jgi:hypothetical protein
VRGAAARVTICVAGPSYAPFTAVGPSGLACGANSYEPRQTSPLKLLMLDFQTITKSKSEHPLKTVSQ